MFKELHAASLGQLAIPRLLSRPTSLLRARKYVAALTIVTSTGLLLRLPLLARFPFREDEAIYAFWAIEAWHDPLFLSVWPDKPPLFIWLLSATFSLFGPGEASARALNISISLLTIAMVAAMARRLWGRRAGIVAALALALNPFAISFAPTAFTDPLLVLAGSLAAYMAICKRPFWAGFWLGVAVMTKQQGLLYLPLVAGFTIYDLRFTNGGKAIGKVTIHSPVGFDRLSPRGGEWLLIKSLLHFGFGLALIILPILYWDSLRWSVAPSPWDLSIRNYGTLGLLPPSQWIDRILDWSQLIWYLTSSWFVWGWLLLALPVQWILKIGPRDAQRGRATTKIWTQSARRTHRGHREKQGRISTDPNPPHPFTLSSCHLVTFFLWSIAFLILHIVTTLQPWDRYLLPLAPVLALFIGHLVSRVSRLLPTPQFAIVGAILMLLLLPPALEAADGQLPIGADHGAYEGLREAVAWVQQEAGEENGRSSILYHRVLGWHHQFYFDEQIRAHKVQLRWFPNSVYLIDNANKAPHLRKFLIQPTWASNRDLAMRTTMSQMTLRPRAKFGNFSVLELSQPAQPFCSWCLCRIEP